jgi:hypothetical protein
VRSTEEEELQGARGRTHHSTNGCQFEGQSGSGSCSQRVARENRYNPSHRRLGGAPDSAPSLRRHLNRFQIPGELS